MIKKIKYFIIIIVMFSFSSTSLAKYDKLAYDFSFNDLDGSILKLSDFKDKVIIVVNVASQCGFTSQYEDMQKIWEKYQNKQLVVIGVPSNNFGNQEPGGSKEIKTFCEAKFGITFPMTEKVNVKGDNIHPFYSWAKKNHGKNAVPKWNFYKIIIGKDGKIAETFTSMTNPSSKKFIKVIDKLIE
jgi:glutathione peroxidase